MDPLDSIEQGLPKMGRYKNGMEQRASLSHVSL